MKETAYHVNEVIPNFRSIDCLDYILFLEKRMLFIATSELSSLLISGEWPGPLQGSVKMLNASIH